MVAVVFDDVSVAAADAVVATTAGDDDVRGGFDVLGVFIAGVLENS